VVWTCYNFQRDNIHFNQRNSVTRFDAWEYNFSHNEKRLTDLMTDFPVRKLLYSK
jgi:hypothetical protein